MTWRESTLREIAEVTLGRQRSPQHESGMHMVRYLRAANVKDGSLDLTDVKTMNFSPKEQQIFSLQAGDVLITEGSGSRDAVGASSAWSGEIEGTVCFQNTLLRLRPRGDTDSRFLSWWARSAHASGLFASIATGANIYHLSAERVRALPCTAPSPGEQQRIADFLDAEIARNDKLSLFRKRQVNLLNSRQVSHLFSLVEGLVRRFGNVRLGNVIMRIEQGWSPQCEDRLARENEWGVIKAGCVNNGVFNPLQHKALPRTVSPRVEYALRSGDLLMSRASGSPELIGSVGVVQKLDQKLLLCDKIYRLKVDHTRALVPFVAHMLRSHQVREHIKNGISGAEGMANNLPGGVIRNCLIPKVPLSVQVQVVEDLDCLKADINRARRRLEGSIQLLAERRKALITAAVTGQFDVSTASGRGVTE